MGDIRTLIVDDEPVARAGLRKLLADTPGTTVVGEAADGPAAVAAIRSLAPDLLLLDIQMPGMNGFDVLQAVGADTVPAVVFVTAYDQFAVRAFEIQALDYLLKPFEDERFAAVLARVREHLRRRSEGDLTRRLASLLAMYEQRTAGETPAAASGRSAAASTEDAELDDDARAPTADDAARAPSARERTASDAAGRHAHASSGQERPADDAASRHAHATSGQDDAARHATSGQERTAGDAARRHAHATSGQERTAGDAARRHGHVARLLIRSAGRVSFQPVDEIDWIEAADYYARLHVGGHSHLVRETLASLEEQLDPRRFVRIHRSAIVNVARIAEVRLDWRNRHIVVLRSGKELPLSRRRREMLETAMLGR
jgi:DNA-binding LytR/AlgR family response regulator